MEIRKATHDDLEIISEFQQRMALETENTKLSRDIVTMGVKSVLDDQSKGFYNLATDSGRVVACHMITPEWSDWRNAWVWWIQSLYVLPEYRRKGIFRKMYRHLQEVIGNDKTVAGIRLYVVAGNITAQKAYDDMGMDGEHYRVFEWMKE